MRAKTARIEWVPQSQGGRTAPPIGPRYVAPAKFESAAEAWPGEAWSLVVELIDRAPGSHEWVAQVHFLMGDAPHDLLTEGADFELYEGKRCVARGQVQSQLVRDPGFPSDLIRGRSVPSP
jgi:hypothetical protein